MNYNQMAKVKKIKLSTNRQNKFKVSSSRIPIIQISYLLKTKDLTILTQYILVKSQLNHLINLVEIYYSLDLIRKGTTLMINLLLGLILSPLNLVILHLKRQSLDVKETLVMKSILTILQNFLKQSINLFNRKSNRHRYLLLIYSPILSTVNDMRKLFGFGTKNSCEIMRKKSFAKSERKWQIVN